MPLIFSKARYDVIHAISVVLFVCFSSLSHASTLSVDEVINKAGMQRMITQRLLKDYAMAAMHTVEYLS